MARRQAHASGSAILAHAANKLAEQRRLIDTMRDAMRKAAGDLNGIIAVRAITDTTRRIAHDLLAAAEGKAT